MNLNTMKGILSLKETTDFETHVSVPPPSGLRCEANVCVSSLSSPFIFWIEKTCRKYTNHLSEEPEKPSKSRVI